MCLPELNKVMDVTPDFTCGFDIWEQMNRAFG
jgi:hypothetical protein